MSGKIDHNNQFKNNTYSQQGYQNLNNNIWINKKQKLGSGSHGVVYGGYRYITAAKDTKEDVAIKNTKDNIEALICKNMVQKNFNSDYVVKVSNVLKDSKSYYIVYEYCHGNDLFVHATNIQYFKTIQLADLQIILYHTVCGLDDLHKAGYIHRDIKPENIMYDPQKKMAKIIDLGLIKIGIQGCSRTGTELYMAPEVTASSKAENKFYNQSCDVYSLGITILNMLTGCKYKKGEQNEIIINSKQIIANQPEYMQNILTRMIQSDPNKRITIADIKTALEENMHKEIKNQTISQFIQKPAQQNTIIHTEKKQTPSNPIVSKQLYCEETRKSLTKDQHTAPEPKIKINQDNKNANKNQAKEASFLYKIAQLAVKWCVFVKKYF